jgi:hypothetical protein
LIQRIDQRPIGDFYLLARKHGWDRNHDRKLLGVTTIVRSHCDRGRIVGARNDHLARAVVQLGACYRSSNWRALRKVRATGQGGGRRVDNHA